MHMDAARVEQETRSTPSSQSTSTVAGDETGHPTCERHLTPDTSITGKRKREEAEGHPVRPPSAGPSRDGITYLATASKSTRDTRSGGDGIKPASKLSPTLYIGIRQLLEGLQECFKRWKDVDFLGSCAIPHDPTVSDKDRVRMTTHDIWKATGYRFTVKDHPRIKNGHKTRLACSQDRAYGKRGRASRVRNSDPQQREVVGKPRYPCNSRLLVSCKEGKTPGERLVTVRLRHYNAHLPYYDTDVPPEAVKAIWENLSWASPVMMVPRAQTLHTHPTPDRLLRSAPTVVAVDDDLESGSGYGSSEESCHEDKGDGGEDDDDEDQLLEEKEQEPRHGLLEQKEASNGAVFRERLRGHIETLRDFCDGLEYQLQFNDHRMLEVLEREGSSMLRLARDCLQREGRLTLKHGPPLEPPNPSTPSE